MNARQREIVEIVRGRGFASIAELSARHDVSTQTVRRDLALLCEACGLTRFHGGVGLATSTRNADYEARRDAAADAKAQIGAAVAAMIPNHASVFLNIGTTTEAIARALIAREGLRIITNNLNIAQIFRAAGETDVSLAGGRVRADGGVVGEAAVESLARFRLDFGVIGVSGVDADGTLLDFDESEVRAAQTIIGNARRVILAADATKFGRRAMVKIADASAIDTLVTDSPPPEATLAAFEEADVDVVWPGRDALAAIDNPSAA
ncbi:MAG: DeoR/GlpR family DNA-binding transcription regulator [Pseudomonadota bacterium]